MTLLERLLFPPRRADTRALLRRVEGLTVLVTGASRGIGEALAARLGEAGAHLILTARSEVRLREVKEAVEARGGTAEVHALDLRDPVALDSFLEVMGTRRIDVFVNNAGKSIRRSLLDSLDRAHDFDRTMALNYHAPVRLMLRLIPHLAQSRGQVVNVSALNLLMVPMPHWAAYQASKTAFDQWLRCAVPELRALGIAVTSLYLPLVRTAMIEPTHAYRNAPAMSPDQVALLICRCLVSRTARWIPWWAWPLETGSILLRPLVERIFALSCRKGPRAPGA
ncbi:MAG: hypothetical protein RL318_1171 [Fibrobacterota bacterium]|jgi:short-subunit dehydrogenase